MQKSSSRVCEPPLSGVTVDVFSRFHYLHPHAVMATTNTQRTIQFTS